MSKCAICCADEMIVGRWYKLVTYPYYNDEAPTNYTVKYYCDSDKVTLIHDTLYTKEKGTFTVTCKDMYGATDSKTITIIDEPTIQRNSHVITPTSWEDLKTKVNEIGENAKIYITKGIYRFELINENFDVPSGVSLDFNNSIVYLTAPVNEDGTQYYYNGFRFTGDFNELLNVTFIGVNMGKTDGGLNYTEGSHVINVYAGKYHKIKNVHFKRVAGYNFNVGTWSAYWYMVNIKDQKATSRWRKINNYAGYVDDNGNLVASNDSWTMTEMVESVQTYDKSYYVGHSGMWIPTTVRVYDIAWYDENKNFIRLDKNQQYFRLYYYPQNAKYVRYCIHQSIEPTTEGTGRDDTCVMRMLSGNEVVKDKAPNVVELYVENFTHTNTRSGCFQGVGLAQDVHIVGMMNPTNGWTNGWGFDIEDCWNGAMGYTIAHSYFGKSTVYTHGVQGVSFISCVMGIWQMVNNCHFPTLINSLCNKCNNTQVRGNATAINSYWGTPSNSEFQNAYSFGAITDGSSEWNTVTNGINTIIEQYDL